MFLFASELVSYLSPRDLHRRAAYSICESSFSIHHGGYRDFVFVLDDTSTSYRFTMRTEHLTKCCEPLLKLRMRLLPCKIDFSPPVS